MLHPLPGDPGATDQTAAARVWSLLFLCWVLASASTLGSLFFSMVMGREPCVLCWYQRIFMFPLPLILGMGLLRFDPRCVRYALPLAIAGTGFALYHCLLYMGVIPERMTACTQGVSCADVDVELAGFVTIPLLSLAAFVAIVGLLVAIHRKSRALPDA
ncbi:disulfide bond formation protein B [Uliginosibacterium sp. H1]|uniref:disulfide bond formation protein B n=1 Tax=Uliginosibacterium sp. H1 TaxID=3114757 RepID=UPI002E196878|nr:disulfide bond formation protein B [Uliginosibacterium sp. H1]